MRTAVLNYVGGISTALHHTFGVKPNARGSLAYRSNRTAIWRDEIPEKYERIVDLVPGRRVLELGAAEGVLSLLLAQNKDQVLALEKNESRHQEALRLKASMLLRERDVGRCEMVLGDIRERFDLLQGIDTLVAVRSIYYLRDQLGGVFDRIGRSVPNVVLCGNRFRAQKYRNGDTDDAVGHYNYYASLEGMTWLLEGCGYAIVRKVTEGTRSSSAERRSPEADSPLTVSRGSNLDVSAT